MENQQKAKTLEELLAENGIETNKNEQQPPVQQIPQQPQQQQVVSQQPQQQQIVQQPPVQQQVPTQQYVVPVAYQQSQQQVMNQGNNQFYKPTVLMSSEDVSNLDVQKFLGDVAGGGIKLEEDFYLVECIGIELIKDKDFTTGAEVQKYRFSLKVLSNSSGTPIDGVVLHKKTTLSFGDRSNNYAIYKAFTKQVPQGKYNILECKGKRCLIRVENKPSQTGGVFSVITLFAPAKN